MTSLCPPRSAKAALSIRSAGYRRIVRATSLAITGAMVAFAPAAQAIAQGTVSPPPRTPQGNDGRFKYAGMGAAIGGLLTVGYYFMSERGERSGKCGVWNCAAPYLTISGAFAGLFLARELAAQRRAEAPRVGDALTFSAAEYTMPAAPTSLALRDSLLAVATDSGAQVMSTVARAAALRRRGAGLSDVRLVALNGNTSRLFIGTGAALWETPTTTGLLSRVLDGAVDALAASENTVVAASGNLLRVRRGEGESARVDTLRAPAHVTSATHDAISGNWWITTDSLLLELTTSGDTPVLAQRAIVSGQARAVAASKDHIALALGSDGLAIFQRDALGTGTAATPQLLRGEPRFAFDIAFLGGDLYVAGGVDGITRVTLLPAPRIIGSSRQARYATNIMSDGTALWVADRTPGSSRVLRITP